MARSRVGECSIDGLTRAYTRAHGVPDEWKTRARCRGMNHTEGRLAFAWISEDSTMNEMALQFCGMCPAQWECASYAVAADEPWGIWGMRYDDLIWLKRRRDAAKIIERAQRAGDPIQFTVRRARGSVRVPTAC